MGLKLVGQIQKGIHVGSLTERTCPSVFARAFVPRPQLHMSEPDKIVYKILPDGVWDGKSEFTGLL
jgi:hypothetical protein